MPLLARLSIDPFEHYLIRSIAKFIHVNHVVFHLSNLTDLFPQVPTGPRTTRSSFNAAIAISKFRTTDGVNSFSNRAALFFNLFSTKDVIIRHSEYHCTTEDVILRPECTSRIYAICLDRVRSNYRNSANSWSILTIEVCIWKRKLPACDRNNRRSDTTPGC